MKTFQQFNEDVKQLQRDLNALSRQTALKTRLLSRRKSAKKQSQSVGSEFNQKSAAQIEAQKERMK